MTKQDIREAYHRMDPPLDAKERMMRNIMKQTNNRKRSTARPTAHRSWTAIPAALLLVAVLAVGGWMLWPDMAEHPLEESQPTDSFLFIEPKDYRASFEGIPEVYQDILVTYAQAIDENWSEEQWSSAGLNAELYSEAENSGYALFDLDGNGSDELLVCTEGEIYELYTIVDGAAKELLNWKIDYQATRLSIRFCAGDFVKVVQKTSGGGTSYNIYRLGTDGDGDIALVMERHVLMTSDGDHYAGPNEKDAIRVSEAEAMGTLDGYQTQTIPLTLFNREEKQEAVKEVPPGYSYILNKYVQAVTDSWTPEQYSMNGLSYVLHDKDIYKDYGYAMMDLNGDGVDELIITDGEYIYDLYIRMDDGGAGHIITSGDRMRHYLCEGNIIGYQGSSGAGNSCWEYSRLLPGGDSEIVMYLQFNTDTYYKIEGGSDKMVAITKDEAGDIINTYKSIEIPFDPILRMEPAEEKIYPSTYTEALRELIDFAPGIGSMYMGLVDVSGDGNSELLLGTADSFGTVYTLREDGLYQVISYGKGEGFTLCEDGIIMHHDPNDPHDPYIFISVKDNVAVTVDELRYHPVELTWYRDTVAGKEYLTEEEKDRFIKDYGPLSVTMIPVQEYLDG